MNTRRLGLALIVLVSLSSTACLSPEAVEGILNTKLDTKVLAAVQSGELQHVGDASADAAETMLGALTGVFFIYLWYRAHHGDPWISMAKEAFIGLAVALLLIRFWNNDSGAPRFIYDLSQALVAKIRPAGIDGLADVFKRQLEATSLIFQPIDTVIKALEAGRLTEVVRQKAETLLNTLRAPGIMAMLSISAAAALLVRVFLYATYTFLLVFHWVTMPLFAVTLVLPQSRRVFYGWLQSYISVCLWPLIWEVYDIIMFILPWTDLTGATSIDPFAVNIADRFWASNFMLAVLNLAFITAYLSTPIVANKIVTGVSRAATS